jgi:hypothetical protein
VSTSATGAMANTSRATGRPGSGGRRSCDDLPYHLKTDLLPGGPMNRRKAIYRQAPPRHRRVNDSTEARADPTRGTKTLTKGDERGEQKSIVRQFLEIAVPVVTLGGILVYSVIYVAYDKFYGSIGIHSGDVGLSYSTILSHSVGFLTTLAFTVWEHAKRTIFWYVIVVSFCFVFLILATPVDPFTLILRLSLRRFIAISLLLILVPAIFLSLRGGPYGRLSERATEAANDLIGGQAVLPLRGARNNDLLLYIHADPVTIFPVTKDEAGNISKLKDKELFYLGQANGQLVLYSWKDKLVIYLPSSAVVMTAIDCTTEPLNAMCLEP